MTNNKESITKMAWGLAEIAASTGLSLGFLRNEVRRGALKATKFGRRTLILDQNFRNYLTRHEEEPPETSDKCAERTVVPQT